LLLFSIVRFFSTAKGKGSIRMQVKIELELQTSTFKITCYASGNIADISFCFLIRVLYGGNIRTEVFRGGTNFILCRSATV